MFIKLSVNHIWELYFTYHLAHSLASLHLFIDYSTILMTIVQKLRFNFLVEDNLGKKIVTNALLYLNSF